MSQGDQKLSSSALLQLQPMLSYPASFLPPSLPLGLLFIYSFGLEQISGASSNHVHMCRAFVPGQTTPEWATGDFPTLIINAHTVQRNNHPPTHVQYLLYSRHSLHVRCMWGAGRIPCACDREHFFSCFILRQEIQLILGTLEESMQLAWLYMSLPLLEHSTIQIVPTVSPLL